MRYHAMNNNQPGRIQIHGDGIGGVTEELIEKRAEELARMDGRRKAGEQDRHAAREDLLNPGPPPSPEADERTAPVELWSMAAASRAHRGVHTDLDDEESAAEQLVSEGVEEADRDQRLSASDEQAVD